MENASYNYNLVSNNRAEFTLDLKENLVVKSNEQSPTLTLCQYSFPPSGGYIFPPGYIELNGKIRLVIRDEKIIYSPQEAVNIINDLIVTDRRQFVNSNPELMEKFNSFVIAMTFIPV